MDDYNKNIITLFDNYKTLLEERLDRYRLLNIGEDTIRYDFFSAILETYQLRPAQIQIEVPINAHCFIPIIDKNSKRKEKPLIDLVVTEPELNISAEFALFRQNSNENGSINKTARTVKMLNDMIRVALETYYTQTRGLFICVADHKILGHQMKSKIIGRFPSDYVINNEIITYQLQQKTNHFDRRFLNVYGPMNRNIKSTLIFNERIEAKYIKNETRLLIWEVSFAKD